ncbi:YciI family protein [Rhizobium grahamii]|uniref:YciI family protein n=1 Tax=Rhizobium grahamii TaxID=1120045 RepID=A0A5Q0C2S2_9HYPH|nr:MULTISPECIES: YciI family protein [Rhizobium]QFY59545.1 YciI family protein [Rhizobium grahamii]QRM47932.1 YciI family protein [Rhizobium sp. BG6]
MKYLCQVFFEPSALEAMSAEEKRQLDRDSLAYDRQLIESGHMIAAQALQHPKTAVTVRVRNGETAMTDGPFAETKEQLGGFILIDAKDLNDAVRVAAGIPLARMGAIEVRPIYAIPVEM